MKEIRVSRSNYSTIQKFYCDLMTVIPNKANEYRFACFVNSVVNGVTAIGPLLGEYKIVVDRKLDD